jgi:hypothetical protein
VATGGIMIVLLPATIVCARVSGFNTKISRPDDEGSRRPPRHLRAARFSHVPSTFSADRPLCHRSDAYETNLPLAARAPAGDRNA